MNISQSIKNTMCRLLLRVEKGRYKKFVRQSRDSQTAILIKKTRDKKNPLSRTDKGFLDVNR